MEVTIHSCEDCIHEAVDMDTYPCNRCHSNKTLNLRDFYQEDSMEVDQMSYYNISVKKSSYKKLRQIQVALVDHESGRMPSWDDVIRLLLDLYEEMEASK